MNSNDTNIIEDKKGLDSNQINIPEKFLYKPINSYSDSPLTPKVTIAYGLYSKFLNKIFRNQINIELVRKRLKYKRKNRNNFDNNTDINSGRRTFNA